MKKILSILMCAVFIMQSGAVFVSAEEKKGDPTELITYTKQLFSIGSGFDEFDYNYNSDSETGLTRYRFDWENTASGETVAVVIDDNKYISYYDKDEKDNSGLGTLTAEEAKAAADSFLSLVIPEEYIDNLVYEPKVGTSKYYITYRYTVNGVPYAEDNFAIWVSKYTGTVTSYDGPTLCPFTLDYPEPENIISAEEAHSLYKDLCSLIFEYRSYYDKQEEGYKLFPAYYMESYTSNMIDAFTGEGLETKYYDSWATGGSASSAMDMAVEEETANDEDYGLTEAEIASIEDKADILTVEEALAIVEKEIPLPDKTNNLNYGLEKENDEYFWNITIKKGEYRIYICVNAGTGEIINYSDDDWVYKSNTAPDYDTMLETAESLVSAFSNGKYKKTELKYEEYSYDSGNIYGYGFKFVRVENGIKYSGNYIDVGFDAAGKLFSYYTLWQNNIIDLPDTVGAIGLDAAYDKLFHVSAPLLTYIKTDEGVRLVYAFGYDEVCLDKYGNRIDPYYGTPYTEEEVFSGYTDIEGSRYESIIKQLLNNGYYIEREEFKPNAPITPSDFASFFRLSGKETEEGYVFNRIPDKYYGETLTRYDIAEILASLKVDEKILSSDKIYSKELYNDEIASEYLPYVAICYILGYMTGDSNGLFNGDRVVTNGEAAMILYKYLTA